MKVEFQHVKNLMLASGMGGRPPHTLARTAAWLVRPKRHGAKVGRFGQKGANALRHAFERPGRPLNAEACATIG